MPRNKRIFPFFLDEGIQQVGGTGATAWEGLSSFVEFTGTGTKEITLGPTDTYGRPIQHGTLVIVKRTQASSSALTVNPSDEFSSNDGQIVLKAAGDHAVFLWKAPGGSNTLGEWVEMTFDIATSVSTLDDVSITGHLSMATINAAITGAGSAFGDATQLILGSVANQFPVIKVNGASSSGIKLAGNVTNTQTFKLVNTGSNTVKIYPPNNGGSDVFKEINNLGDGVGFDLAASAVVDVIFDGAGATKNIYIG